MKSVSEWITLYMGDFDEAGNFIDPYPTLEALIAGIQRDTLASLQEKLRNAYETNGAKYNGMMELQVISTMCEELLQQI